MIGTPATSGSGEAEKQKMFLIIIALIIVLAIVFAAVAIWILTSSSDDSTSRETLSYSDTITVDDVRLEVDNFNGEILVSTWDNDEYKIDIEIEVVDSLINGAEDYIEQVEVDFDDRVVQGEQRLSLEIDAPTLYQTYLTITVEVMLPAEATLNLDLSLSNGNIHLTDIAGGELVAKTTNGNLYFDNVFAESIEAQTTNGNIDCDFPCTVSGDYDLRTTNGGIDIQVSSSSEVGYDVAISTTNGNVEIDLPNLDYSVNEDEDKEATTQGFDDKTVKITIDATTTNGSIDIHT